MTLHAAPSHPKGKVLVVDDDRLVLATVTHGLATAGFEVIDADNGDDAILLARAHRPDLALLDIRMEGLTGFDVAAYLREALGTPFMFLSAFADEETERRVRELGAVAYLIKPLDIAQIVPAVESALKAQKARHALGQPSGAPLAGLPPDGVNPPPPLPASVVTRAPEPALPPAGSVPAVAPAVRTVSWSPDPLTDPVPLAVGVLMHRYSLSRQDALERLRRTALADHRTVTQQAAALVDAVELLARPGGL
ncbi:response regulator [Ideonella livida]|uniref:Response regulator n=1 Tax=Ideonella livida TaxID=2707176 RepID=A0A7C9THV0_9BURK|nr:response regulator [Ideonella livida]NDY89944.1 response regulator [Ideonella livida]